MFLKVPLSDNTKQLITDLVFAEATEFIVAPAVFFHPFAGLKFLVAPGLVFIEDHEEDAHNEVNHMHSAPLLAEVEDDHGDVSSGLEEVHEGYREF